MSVSLAHGAQVLAPCSATADLARIGRGLAASAEPVWDCLITERHLGSTRADLMASCWLPERGPELARWYGAEWLAHWPELGGVPLVWLEWDCADGTPSAPLSSACVSDNILGATAIQRPPTDEVGWTAVVARLLERFDLPDTLAPVLRARDALGAGGELLHLAPLHARGRRTLRTTWFLQAGALPRWLHSLGWSGPADTLPSLLHAMAAPFHRVGVQLEFGPHLGGYLGIECPEWLQATDLRVHPLRLWLTARGMDDPGVWDVLSSWPGRDGGGLRSGYVKVAHEPWRATPWVAKAYFGISPRGQ